MEIRVVKRNGDIETFNKDKIKDAVFKALEVTGEDNNTALKVVNAVENRIRESEDILPTVYAIEKMVFEELVEKNLTQTAKTYESYRAVQEYKRRTNTTDETIINFLNRQEEEIAKENSNKNPTVLNTQRDLVAGEISKDIMMRVKMKPEFADAHKSGALHYHDLDFGMQPMINCCLINIEDILKNGTVLNGKMYESPETFEKACGIIAQVIAGITSNQYGGNSVNVKHLGEFLYKAEQRIINEELSIFRDYEVKPKRDNNKILEERVHKKLKEVCRAGIRSLLWQINGFATHSGQSPFTTLFLEMDFGGEYEKYQAMVIEEIINQRYLGMKNENGVAVSPAFPKLIFVLDEYNVHPDSPYYYLKKASIKCSAKRLVPDYISAKKMRELYEGNVFSPMGCRSELSPWYDENGKPKFEGRFNMGVVSINLPQIAILAKGEEEVFWRILEHRLALAKQMLLFRYEELKGTTSDSSPLHWQYGGLARLDKGEKIDKLLEHGYATISLGYIGVYEMTKVMKGVSHTDPVGTDFALRVMTKLKDSVDEWKEETGLGFGLYGTPSEGLCNRLCKIDRERFGIIKDVTDKGWYTNSFHIDVRENVTAFEKLKFESQFQSLSSGGFISYIEVPNMMNNLDALEQAIDFGYNTTMYFEINTKSDYCYECGFDGEMKLRDETTWYCPNCGNDNFDKLHVIRRTCGYLGEQSWNEGKTKEIAQRVLHL